MGETGAFRELAARLPNQRPEPSMTLPRLMWLRENEPEVFASASWFYGSNAHLIHRLTGCVAADPLNAEKAGYDPESRHYAEALMRALDLPLEKMPPVQQMLSTAGMLTGEVKRQVGFGAEDIPLILTTYDAVCAVFGSGVTGPGMACDVSGTVTSLRVAVPEVAPGPAAGLFDQYESATGLHIVGGSNNLGGGLIECWPAEFG